MKLIWIFMTYICIVGGESFQRGGAGGIRRFEAPDVTGEGVFHSPDVGVSKSLATPFDGEFEVPRLSEWNEDEKKFGLKELILGAEAAHQLQMIQEESEIGAILVNICRKCMVTLNVDCISQFCLLDAKIGGEGPKSEDALPKAFVNGVGLHADILCSLCKESRDITCTMKLCVNPELDASQSGIECMQGFCRWKKQSQLVVNTGYNNYMNAWWMPQSVYLKVDQMARELGRAYYDLMYVTSTVREAIGM